MSACCQILRETSNWVFKTKTRNNQKHPPTASPAASHWKTTLFTHRRELMWLFMHGFPTILTSAKSFPVGPDFRSNCLWYVSICPSLCSIYCQLRSRHCQHMVFYPLVQQINWVWQCFLCLQGGGGSGRAQLFVPRMNQKTSQSDHHSHACLYRSNEGEGFCNWTTRGQGFGFLGVFSILFWTTVTFWGTRTETQLLGRTATPGTKCLFDQNSQIIQS